MSANDALVEPLRERLVNRIPSTIALVPASPPSKVDDAIGASNTHGSMPWCLDGPMLRVETYWPPEYPPTTPPVRMVFNIHQRLLRLHSSHYRQLLPAHDEPQTSSVELSLAVNLCVRPTVFQRVKDWCYTGKLGSFLDDRKRVGPAQTSSDAKHKPKRSGRPYKERQYSKQAQKRKRIRHQVSPFEEQYMLSEMREFAAKYGMPKLEQEVLRLLMVPVYRRPVKGCRQLCCVEFHL